MGCALKSGSFRISNTTDEIIEYSNSNNALIFFFLTLLSKLQKLGTAPAMNIQSYEMHLKK